MQAEALNMNLRACGVEALIVQVANLTAVYGIAKLRAKRRNVKQIHPAPDLFIRRETYTDLAVLRRIRSQHMLGKRHDFRNARLVVRAQQRRAVGADDLLADVPKQRRRIDG